MNTKLFKAFIAYKFFVNEENYLFIECYLKYIKNIKFFTFNPFQHGQSEAKPASSKEDETRAPVKSSFKREKFYEIKINIINI